MRRFDLTACCLLALTGLASGPGLAAPQATPPHNPPPPPGVAVAAADPDFG